MRASPRAGGRSAPSSGSGRCASFAPSSGGRRATMPWQPLLEGTLKDRAWESVQAILDDLAPLARDPAGDPSLAGGTSGLAILHGYLAQARGGREPVALA